MSAIIIIFYLLLIVVFLAFGASIVFHLLYYKINRRVSRFMSFIYIFGAILLLISNFILFSQVDWNGLLGSLRL